MAVQSKGNYAFIDSQNLYLGIEDLGWRLDFQRFRVYLAEKYGVMRAYLFIGYLPEQQRLYQRLRQNGYSLILKPVQKIRDGSVKGNVDADLVLQAMIDYHQYSQAVVITGDGDFYSLVHFLRQHAKLAAVLSPNFSRCSLLLRQSAGNYIFFLDNLKQKLELKNGKAPLRDRTRRRTFPS